MASQKVQEILDAIEALYYDDPEFLPEALHYLNIKELRELTAIFAKRSGVPVAQIEQDQTA